MKRIVFDVGPSEISRRVIIDVEKLYDLVYMAGWHLEVNKETSLENSKKALREARKLLDQMCADEGQDPPRYGDPRAFNYGGRAHLFTPSGAGELPPFISIH